MLHQIHTIIYKFSIPTSETIKRYKYVCGFSNSTAYAIRDTSRVSVQHSTELKFIVLLLIHFVRRFCDNTEMYICICTYIRGSRVFRSPPSEFSLVMRAPRNCCARKRRFCNSHAAQATFSSASLESNKTDDRQWDTKYISRIPFAQEAWSLRTAKL